MSLIPWYPSPIQFFCSPKGELYDWQGKLDLGNYSNKSWIAKFSKLWLWTGTKPFRNCSYLPNLIQILGEGKVWAGKVGSGLTTFRFLHTIFILVWAIIIPSLILKEGLTSSNEMQFLLYPDSFRYAFVIATLCIGWNVVWKKKTSIVGTSSREPHFKLQLLRHYM